MLRTRPLAGIWRLCPRLAALSLPPILALSLAACGSAPLTAATPIVVPKRVKLLGGDAKAMNYSTAFIAQYSFQGPAGSEIGGGGASLGKVKPDGRPSTKGGMCCASYPLEWQPDLKLTVRWLEFRARDGKVAKTWYKAENVRIPPYDGQQAGSTWTIFVPGDRVKVVVANPNADDLAPNAGPPPDNDPYLAQGVVDEQWNERYPGGVARRDAR